MNRIYDYGVSSSFFGFKIKIRSVIITVSAFSIGEVFSLTGLKTRVESESEECEALLLGDLRTSKIRSFLF